MSKLISLCDCDHTKCKSFDNRKQVHVGDECYHPNNDHHKTSMSFLKNRKSTKAIDFRQRYINWGM